MASSPKFQSHEQYIASASQEVQPILQRIHKVVQSALPRAVPCISYNIPAFRISRVFFYFAAFKNHIGVYPPVGASSPIADQLSQFRGPKGNLIFPLSQPVPYQLIRQVALALAAEYGATPDKRSKKSAA